MATHSSILAWKKKFFPGGGNGNPLQYSCLENSTDRGAYQAAVHGAAESDVTEAPEHVTAQQRTVYPDDSPGGIQESSGGYVGESPLHMLEVVSRNPNYIHNMKFTILTILSV